jgi:hypothetical protein
MIAFIEPNNRRGRQPFYKLKANESNDFRINKNFAQATHPMPG